MAHLSAPLSVKVPSSSSSPHHLNYQPQTVSSSGHSTYASTKSLSRTSSFQGNNTHSQVYEEQYSQSTLNYTNFPNSGNIEHNDRHYDNNYVNQGYNAVPGYAPYVHTASPDRPPVSPASTARQLTHQLSPVAAGTTPSHRRTNSNSLPPRQQLPPPNNSNNSNYYANNSGGGGYVSSNSSVGSHRSTYDPYNYTNSNGSVTGTNGYGYYGNTSHPPSRIPSPSPSYTGPVPSSSHRRTPSNSSNYSSLPVDMIQKMRFDALASKFLHDVDYLMYWENMIFIFLSL